MGSHRCLGCQSDNTTNDNWCPYWSATIWSVESNTYINVLILPYFLVSVDYSRNRTVHNGGCNLSAGKYVLVFCSTEFWEFFGISTWQLWDGYQVLLSFSSVSSENGDENNVKTLQLGQFTQLQGFRVIFDAMFSFSDKNESKTWYQSQSYQVEISKNSQIYHNRKFIINLFQTPTDLENHQTEKNTW